MRSFPQAGIQWDRIAITPSFGRKACEVPYFLMLTQLPLLVHMSAQHSYQEITCTRWGWGQLLIRLNFVVSDLWGKGNSDFRMT
jgi:hypothetical protein